MRNRLLRMLSAAVLVFVTAMAATGECCAQGPGPEQVVTEALEEGLLYTPLPASEEDADLLAAIRPSVVRVEAGDSHGSGVIWEMTPEEIRILTCFHVVEPVLGVGSAKTAEVIFFTGTRHKTSAVWGDVSRDVVMLSVSCAELTADELLRLRQVRLSETLETGMTEGEAVCAAADESFLITNPMTVTRSRFDLTGQMT
ncbi:MAG: trypsin-like peptidase domain-containing protein, partial [Butyrivibrio sp.]|nr:trypsin-like peptidase domain-containing protein [Butyrivibrio sp.]